MATHELKTWPEYFKAVKSGSKTVEIRKDDRGFEVDDELVLQEYDPDEKDYLGGEITCTVNRIWRDVPGLLPDHVLMGIVVTHIEA